MYIFILYFYILLSFDSATWVRIFIFIFSWCATCSISNILIQPWELYDNFALTGLESSVRTHAFSPSLESTEKSRIIAIYKFSRMFLRPHPEQIIDGELLQMLHIKLVNFMNFMKFSVSSRTSMSTRVASCQKKS